MAATKDQMAASIEPGSLEYGTRQSVVDGLPTQGGPVGGATPGPRGELPVTPGSPFDLTSSGAFESNPDIPPTAGLSVGAGPGPALAETEEKSSYAERLRTMALNANTPQLRAQARAALKALYIQGRL